MIFVEEESVEITPGMIEAGTQELWETSLVEFPNPADRLDVKRILEAALRISSARQKNRDEVKITPRMIEAGAQILRDRFDAGDMSASNAAREVFEVMVSWALFERQVSSSEEGEGRPETHGTDLEQAGHPCTGAASEARKPVAGVASGPLTESYEERVKRLARERKARGGS